MYAATRKVQPCNQHARQAAWTNAGTIDNDQDAWLGDFTPRSAQTSFECTHEIICLRVHAFFSNIIPASLAGGHINQRLPQPLGGRHTQRRLPILVLRLMSITQSWCPAT